MEDALVLLNRNMETVCVSSLNPCFNGRCTRTFGVMADVSCHPKS